MRLGAGLALPLMIPELGTISSEKRFRFIAPARILDLAGYSLRTTLLRLYCSRNPTSSQTTQIWVSKAQHFRPALSACQPPNSALYKHTLPCVLSAYRWKPNTERVLKLIFPAVEKQSLVKPVQFSQRSSCAQLLSAVGLMQVIH